jgi:predicted RNA-binding Zn-ribbon protein involved in translation (DUF1610 family)
MNNTLAFAHKIKHSLCPYCGDVNFERTITQWGAKENHEVLVCIECGRDWQQPITQSELEKEIVNELLLTARHSALYVANGKVLEEKLAEKYNITVEEVSKRLNTLGLEINNHISELVHKW